MASKKTEKTASACKRMFLTIADVCQMLSMKDSTARDWIDEQEAENGLDVRRFGRNVRISESDFYRVVELHKSPPILKVIGQTWSHVK